MHDIRKTIISAQVDTSQRDRLADLAMVNRRSLSGELRRALDTYLRLAEPTASFSLGGTSSAANRGGSGTLPARLPADGVEADAL